MGPIEDRAAIRSEERKFNKFFREKSRK